ncbi:AAA family ATPase [Caldivirga sp.]|uniref:AAA family ATPase n=1 Tax=Caldivirga sp. TaxID=2080243 RepID=UPI003D09EBBA
MVAILKHLSIEDYGPFNRLDVDLSDITILVGRNNTGKSTFLEAVTLLLLSVNNFNVPKLPIDPLFTFRTKGKYMVNLRSGKRLALISGKVDRQGIHDVKVRISVGADEFKDIYGVAIEKIVDLFIELTPESREIVSNAFSRIRRIHGELRDIAARQAFATFSNNVQKVLRSYVDYLQSELTFIATYINDDPNPVNIVVIPPMPFSAPYVLIAPIGTIAMSNEVINKLIGMGFNADEANKLLNNQISKAFSRSIIIPGSIKANISPINVNYPLSFPFTIDQLPPDKQTELIDLLRREVNYFYDYRNGQVILNFSNDGRISLPYDLMGNGFKALVTMMGLIIMGIDVAIIDEPEAHLHPGFMDVITRYMIQPRFLNHIQLIMATQSMEFLDYLLNAAKEDGALDKIKLIRLYLMPDGGIDYEQLSGEEAYDERHNLEADLRGP